MFLDYFGLREQPFGVTPDPRFLYLSDTHREALASIYYGVESGRGFMALIATPGAGKSTLLFYLLERLQSVAHTAFLFQTQCSSHEFMRLLAADIGLENCGEDIADIERRLNAFLMEGYQRGKRFVLVVDEAQGLSDSVLEIIRMLSNFETPRAKLMQIVFAGQPELAQRLANPHLVQLRQRVSILARLRPLTLQETGEYIDHRLRVAGRPGPQLFDRPALSAIHRHSLGIPRNINNLCFHAMTVAFAKDRKSINAGIIDEIASDLDLKCICSDEAAEVDTRGAVRSVAPVSASETLSHVPCDLSASGESHKPVNAGIKTPKSWPNVSGAFRSVRGWLHALRGGHNRSKIDQALVFRRAAASVWFLGCVVLGVQVGRKTLRDSSGFSRPSTTVAQSISAARLDVISTRSLPQKLPAPSNTGNHARSKTEKKQRKSPHGRSRRLTE